MADDRPCPVPRGGGDEDAQVPEDLDRPFHASADRRIQRIIATPVDYLERLPIGDGQLLCTEQFRDVPGPQFVGFGGQELALGVVWTAQLVTTLADFTIGRQQPVHRALRGKVCPFVEQRGVHLGGRVVHEAFGTEFAQHCRSLREGGLHRSWRSAPVHAGAACVQCTAYGRGAHRRRQFGHRCIDHEVVPGSALSRAIPKSAETFFERQPPGGSQLLGEFSVLLAQAGEFGLRCRRWFAAPLLVRCRQPIGLAPCADGASR